MEPAQLAAAAAHYDRMCDRGDRELELIDEYMSEGGTCDPSRGCNIYDALDSMYSPEVCEELGQIMREKGDTAAGLFVIRKIRDYCYKHAEALAESASAWEDD